MEKQAVTTKFCTFRKKLNWRLLSFWDIQIQGRWTPKPFLVICQVSTSFWTKICCNFIPSFTNFTVNCFQRRYEYHVLSGFSNVLCPCTSERHANVVLLHVVHSSLHIPQIARVSHWCRPACGKLNKWTVDYSRVPCSDRVLQSCHRSSGLKCCTPIRRPPRTERRLPESRTNCWTHCW